MDIFYSPKHREVMKRKRKERKIDHDAITLLGNKSIDVFWKDTPIDPSKNLTKLSQFASAYASAKIDKEEEVRNLIKEKKERIRQMEDQLTKKNRIHRNILNHNLNKCNRVLSA